MRLAEAAGAALLGAGLLVVLEWAVVTWLARAELAGAWELRDGLKLLAPIAWLTVSAGAVVASVPVLLARSPRWEARVGVASVAGALGGAVGSGVTQGRHFASLPVRAAFVASVVALAGVAVYVGVPWYRRAVERAPRVVALFAGVSALVCELVNHLVLPRLYPAFHQGLSALVIVGAAVLGAGLVAPRWLLACTAPVVAWALIVTPARAHKLALADNLRLIFLERAPLLALGVHTASCLAPPPPLDESTAPLERPIGGGLEVDWRGRDVVLISVDALRADHLGAYGYGRPITPHLDALAKEGVLFLRAYCPTPHTSYSVTSMMTGKNMRPLLAQGLGDDSDTFARLLRGYGYRTAAFYPPAVFFIDGQLFTGFRERQLDFEYARVQFADPHERAQSIEHYLDAPQGGAGDHRLFLWVHLFEPHEPYVAHPEHPFGDRDVDRYDSEIAAVDDGIGEIVLAVRKRRPRAVIVITADHGEEFGEHHGRYHGTTVYEEQVRVPLIVATPGLAPRRIESPVQTIDILPTVLSALDVPRPPRIAGNNLGAWLAGGAPPKPATAFAETDEQTVLADAEWRLVCARRVGACALYNLDVDPGETHDTSAAQAERFAAMKAALRRVEASHGRYERGGGGDTGEKPWPDPIRRGLAGDGDAAREVAALLDDSDVMFRRKAASVLFDLKRKEAAPELRLSLARDDDDAVRRWSALALTRLGEGAPRTGEMLDDPDVTWRRLAALALAENGDARGAPVLVQWWDSGPLPYGRAREVLAALGQTRAKEATPVLVKSLDDVRLRPYLADTLAAIGQPAARAPLAQHWATERYQNTRVALGTALVRLGAKWELVGPLVRFLGTPDPLPNGLDLAVKAGLLQQVGGPSSEQLRALVQRASQGAWVKLFVPLPSPGADLGLGYRLLVRARVNDGRPGQVRVGARLAGLEPASRVGKDKDQEGAPVELDPRHAISLEFSDGTATEKCANVPPELLGPTREVRWVFLSSPNVVIEAAAVVPLANELPPPPKEAWTPPRVAAPSVSSAGSLPPTAP